VHAAALLVLLLFSAAQVSFARVCTRMGLPPSATHLWLCHTAIHGGGGLV
jgi:hypothetical protein